MIEKISKYREEKIKKEFQKLEDELRHDEERQRQTIRKEQKMKDYFTEQRDKLANYQLSKAQQEFEVRQKTKEDEMHEKYQHRERVVKNEEMVSL